jgi:hypothetical protein
MGSQRKLIEQLQRMMAQMIQPAIHTAQTEPPELTRLKGDASSFLDQVNSKDMRNLKTGTFWNMQPLADQNKQRDLLYNEGATGQAALGTAPAGLLALDKQNAADHAASDYGSNFENAVQGATANAKNTLLGIGQEADARNQGVLGPITNLTQFASTVKKPPSFLQSLISGGLSALPGILAAF